MTKTKGKKVRKRIRLTVGAKTITNYLVIAAATVLVVGLGMIIPAVFLRHRSAPQHLPSGYVDIDEIRLYGAAYTKSEQGLTDALLAYSSFLYSYGSMIDTSTLPYRDIARYEDGYSQIGIRDSGPEFICEFSEFLRDDYGYEVPAELEIRDMSEGAVLVGALYYSDEGYVLDTTSGVPIEAHITFTSSEDMDDMSQFFYQIVEMYNGYTGLDFMVELDTDDPTDEYYWGAIMTSDDHYRLDVVVKCRLFYPIEAEAVTDPNAEPYYVWNVELSVADIEEYGLGVG